MYNNGRTGWNPHETHLTVANVKAGFHLLFTDITDGQTYAQPLYVPHLKMGPLGTHNIIFVATESNTVYAFDADQAGPPLWSQNLTPSGETLQTSDDYNNSEIPHIGISSTPVIDLGRHAIYAVAASKTLASPVVYHQRLHALDLATGTELKNSPVDIQAKFPGASEPQDGNGNIVFDPQTEFNRPALLLFHNNIYIAFGAHQDVGVYQGWVIAYNKRTLAQVAVFNTSANLPAGVGAASVWQSTVGLSADSKSIYFTTANGPFDANTGGLNYGDTALRLTSKLAVADYFAPCNQESLDLNDVDLGSGGVMILPLQAGKLSQLATFAGKEGTIYLLNRKAMGGYTPSFVADNFQCTDGVTQEFFRALGIEPTDTPNRHAFWGAPTYFKDSSGNRYIYYSGSDAPIIAYNLNNGIMTPGVVAGGAPNQTPYAPPFDFPFGGAIPSISSNRGNPATAILWAVKRAGQVTGSINGSGPLTLDAFAATDLTNQLVFDIPAGNWPYENFAFLIPTVANGKVYLAADGELNVFGVNEP